MALELSYVNSSLQLLKEELHELSGGRVEADRPEGCVCGTRLAPGVCVCVCTCEDLVGAGVVCVCACV